MAVITYHSRQKRNVICSRDFGACSPFDDAGDADILTIVFNRREMGVALGGVDDTDSWSAS